MGFESSKTFLFGSKPRQDPKGGSESHSAIELDEQPPHNTGIMSLNYKYTFDPLPESGYIRLFELFPRPLLGTIAVRLFVVSMNDLPRYEAISYVWGDPTDTDTRTIICNYRSLRITRNLHDALKRFRASSKSTSQILWADAICINQDDLKERERQVRLMPSIYTKACRVLVWLGPDKFKKVLPAHPWLYSLDESKRRQSMKPFSNSRPEDQVLCEATKVLLRRPWFERVWALPEIGFAKDATFFCGGHKIDWESLCYICHFFPPESYRSWNVDVRKILMIEDSFQFKRNRGSPNLNVFQLLNGARSYQATDPRDKVYALLGHPVFEQDDGSEFIPIDYSQTREELYLTVAKRLLEEPSGLSELLSCVEHTEDTLSSNPGPPSWVPRWDVKRATDSFDPVLHLAPGRSGAPLEHKAPVVQSTGVLVVDGSEVDSIVWQSEVFCMPSSIEPPETKVTFWEMRKILDVIKEKQLASASANNLSIQQGDVLKNLAATLGALPTLQNLSTRSRLYIDHPRHGYGTRSAAIFLSDLPDSRTLDRYLNHQFGYSRHRDLTDRFHFLCVRVCESCETTRPSSYSLAVDRACGNRRFFITKKGHFGLGPSVAQKGDSIVVLAGVSMPQVLRRVSQDYLLCGECYVNEIMYGPAFDLAVKLKTFSIR